MIRDRGNSHFICRDTSMARLAAFLTTTALGRPVVDRTGIEGTFDFELNWGQEGNLEEARDGQNSVPDLLSAVQSVGLKLQSARAPVDFLVIDRVERPSGN